MSTSTPREVRCKKCGTTTERSTALSVNIARSERPRLALLERTFQVFECERCGAPIVVDEPFTYVDIVRKQFFVEHPRRAIEHWRELEKSAQTLFTRNYSPEALPPVARDLGDGVRVRLVFGLEALREKVVAFEAGLDDVALEAVKVELARAGLEPTGEPLRLDSVTDVALRLANSHGTIEVARADYARMQQAPYAPLRELLAGGAFVDLARIV